MAPTGTQKDKVELSRLFALAQTQRMIEDRDQARLRRAILPRNIAKLGSRRRAAGYRYE